MPISHTGHQYIDQGWWTDVQTSCVYMCVYVVFCRLYIHARIRVSVCLLLFLEKKGRSL